MFRFIVRSMTKNVSKMLQNVPKNDPKSIQNASKHHTENYIEQSIEKVTKNYQTLSKWYQNLPQIGDIGSISFAPPGGSAPKITKMYQK